MNLTSAKKCLKKRPLRSALAFSAGVHLIAFYFFPSWATLPAPDREKVIRVKAFLEKKVNPVEKRRPEIKKIVSQKITAKAKKPDIYTPQPRPKSDIIEHAKAVMNFPSTTSIRNPMPIRNLEETFKPVNTIQNNFIVPSPVSEAKTKAQFMLPQTTQPMPRKNRVRSQEPKMHVAVALQPLSSNMDIIKQDRSFQPAPQVAKTFTSSEKQTPNSNVQAKIFSDKVFTSPSKPIAMAASQNHNKRHLNPLGSIDKIQARTPSNLESKSVAQYQPVLPIARNYFAAPLRSISLLQKASIPPGFSDEKLDTDGEPSNSRALKKVASIGEGEVDNVSEEWLRGIKSGFSSQVRTKIAQVKYYPRIARNRGFEGQPVVAFTLGDQGELLELSIANPSPFKLLDEAALDAIKSASPYPPIPELLKMKTIRFTLPISFNLEER